MTWRVLQNTEPILLGAAWFLQIDNIGLQVSQFTCVFLLVQMGTFWKEVDWKQLDFRLWDGGTEMKDEMRNGENTSSGPDSTSQIPGKILNPYKQLSLSLAAGFDCV